MSNKPAKIETTHKHRNLIDDILDAALALSAIGYYVVAEVYNVHLDDKTLALIATAGATLRGAVRKILIRLWGAKLEITPVADE